MRGRSGNIAKRSPRIGFGISVVYSRRVPKPRFALCSLTLFASLTIAAGAARTLDFYFIDVEGGQSTLIVTPAGQTLLVDTGWAGNGGRDAGRILAAMRAAGVSRIDHLLITHFHTDHDGGIVELAAKVPIGTFYDHGSLPFDDL